MEEDYSLYISKEEAAAVTAYFIGVCLSLDENTITDLDTKSVNVDQKLIKLESALENIALGEIAPEKLPYICKIINSNYDEFHKIKDSKLAVDENELMGAIGIPNNNDEEIDGYRFIYNMLLTVIPKLPTDLHIRLLTAVGFKNSTSLLQAILEAKEFSKDFINNELYLLKFTQDSKEEKISRILMQTISTIYESLEFDEGALSNDDILKAAAMVHALPIKFPDLYKRLKVELFEKSDFDFDDIKLNFKAKQTQINTIDDIDSITTSIYLFAECYNIFDNLDYFVEKFSLYLKIFHSKAIKYLRDTEDRFDIYSLYHDYCERKGIEELWKPWDLDEKSVLQNDSEKTENRKSKGVKSDFKLSLPLGFKISGAKNDVLILIECLIRMNLIFADSNQEGHRNQQLEAFFGTSPDKIDPEQHIIWRKNMKYLRVLIYELYKRDESEKVKKQVPNGILETCRNVFRDSNVNEFPASFEKPNARDTYILKEPKELNALAEKFEKETVEKKKTDWCNPPEDELSDSIAYVVHHIRTKHSIPAIP